MIVTRGCDTDAPLKGYLLKRPSPAGQKRPTGLVKLTSE